jgi:hypothetical protein
MKQTPIKVGMKIVMTPAIGKDVFWSACIGKIFEVKDIDFNVVILIPPEEAPQKSAMIGSGEIWNYFRPADQQLEFDFNG